MVVVVVVAGTRRASNRFLKTGGAAELLGGGGFNGWWASKVGESDGGGRGEIGLFFAFLFVGDIIISIQKRGEGESQE